MHHRQGTPEELHGPSVNLQLEVLIEIAKTCHVLYELKHFNYLSIFINTYQ